MTMKKITERIKTIVITSCIVFLSSCSTDFLDKEPPGTAAGSIISSPQGIENLLVGTYDRLATKRYVAGMATDWTFGSVTSDDAYLGSNYTTDPLERYELLPSNTRYTTPRWSEGFDGVFRANQVLMYLKINQKSDNPIPESRALEIEAEAKFLRAWFHFKTTRVFKNIPYIKTEEEMGMPPEEVANESEGWEDIEKDLQFAIDNLPEDSPLGDVGRPSKYSAMAVKAHAHMYQNELNEAKPLLDHIIEYGTFILAENFNDNFVVTRNNNEESIFEIQLAVSGETDGSTLSSMRAWGHQNGPVGIGWGFYQPSHDLFEAYQTTNEGLPILDKKNRTPLAHDWLVPSSSEFIPTDNFLDPRVDYTIARRGVDFQGFAIHEGMSWIRTPTHNGNYMTKKYHYLKENEGYSADGGFNARNVRAYRLGHILLWRAEVAVEEGDLNYARELVNQIRERAKNSDPVMGRCSTYIFDGREVEVDWNQPAANYKVEPYPANSEAFANKENATKAVRLEIRLEFATEGHRFFDLRRWGIIDKVLNDYIEQDGKFRPFMRGATFNSPKDEYFPIPQAQIDLQEGVLKQDPNW